MKRSLCTLLVVAMVANCLADIKVATYTITSTQSVRSSDSIPVGSGATFSNTYIYPQQLTKGNSMTLTLSGFAGCRITEIWLSMKSYSSGGSGYLSITAGETKLASIGSSTSGVTFRNADWNGEYSATYVTVKPKMSNTPYTVQKDEDLVIVIGATVNSLYCQYFQIIYESTYTITATSNNETLGTVSIDGNVITATPTTCVGYASPAYTITQGRANVSQVGNTFTVTASSNCNVQINFAELARDSYIDNLHETPMTSEDYCGEYLAPSIDDKETVAASEQTGVCDHDHYHFVGWVTRKVSPGEDGEPSDLVVAGTPMTANGATYYAVWAQEK